MIFFYEKTEFLLINELAVNYLSFYNFILFISLDFILLEATGYKADKIIFLIFYEQFFGNITSINYFFNLFIKNIYCYYLSNQKFLGTANNKLFSC